MKLNKTILAMSLAGLCASANAAPLQEELQHLLNTHPLIKASDSEIIAASENVEAARAAFFPVLTINASVGKEKIKSTSYLPDSSFRLGNAGTSDTTSSSLAGAKVGATLRMPIYDGANLQSQLNLEKVVQAMSSLDRDAIEQELLLDGITAYMQVARFQLLIELTKINEASTKEQLDLERKRVEGGGGIQVDELQAKTRLQIVRERSVFYNQGLRDALATYEQVFGKAPNLSAFQMIDIANSALPANVQQAIAEGERNSPDIKSAGLEIEKQEQRFNQTKSLKLPKLDLVAMKSEDVNKNALSGRNDEFIGFEMTWNFSFGGEFDAREASAKNRLAATEQRAQNVSNRNKEQVIIAYNQVVNGSERLELLESAADISKSVMMDRKRLRDAGKETALSALDAEVEYYGVLANKINAQIDTKIGGYRLLAAMGKLSSDDLSVFGRFKVPAKPLRVAIDEL